MNILLLGSQHGNELLGERLYTCILQNHPEIAQHVNFLIGNPQARRRNVRFIESDLNRSYSGQKDTYEQRRAGRILHYIRQQKFDLVLDLHTTTCIQPPCLIVSDLRPELHRFLRASTCETIVHINHHIAHTSLIGVCPQAISIEVNKDEITDVVEALCDDIDRYIVGTSAKPTKRIYEVTELLAKTDISEESAKKLQNFVYGPNGFYPVLVGENSYKKHTSYLGFKAYKMYECEV